MWRIVACRYAVCSISQYLYTNVGMSVLESERRTVEVFMEQYIPRTSQRISGIRGEKLRTYTSDDVLSSLAYVHNTISVLS